jgi:phage terminase large subunit-like protein
VLLPERPPLIVRHPGAMTSDAQAVADRAARIIAARLAELDSPRWTPLPHQVPPSGDWYGWLLLAGRGAGKTDVCAEWIVNHVKGPPCLSGRTPHWIGIIAPTLGDAATSCVTGPSGIMAHDPSARMVTVQGGTVVRWPNGSEAKLFGAHTEDEVERLRSGGNRCANWLEEIAAWRYMDAAWDQMRFGLRVGPHPRWVGSTTPKPRGLIKRFDKGEFRDTVVTRASMYDNPHLPQHIRDALEDAYKDTRLGSQELLGLMMDEDENALWAREMIDAARTDPADLPHMTRITVGVDPSGGAGEQGIVVAGKSRLWTPTEGGRQSAHGFVLDDRTCHLKPEGWGQRAVQAAVDWEADDITVEINYGRDMAVSTIRAAAEHMGVSIPINVVTASRGKRVRAEPVSALTEQGRWRFGGRFEQLEDQLCTWTPELGWSPDRLDAMVWDAVGLGVAHLRSSGTGSVGRAAAMSRVIG